MATATGDLVVRLGATTAPFDRKMRQSRATVSRFAAAVGKAKMALGGFAAGFIGLAGARGLWGSIRGTINMMDATGKLSDRIGIATEKLLGLRHAANIMGAGAETLDKSLQFLAKSLGEASTGVGEARYALDLLHLSVNELLAMRPDEQFQIIAERTRRLATQSEKAYVATKLFGRAGVALVNTLDLGARGLNEMQQEAEKLGKTFSRDVAAKAEEANDAILRLKESLKGPLLEAVADITPAIKDFADILREIVAAWRAINKVTGAGVAAKIRQYEELQRWLGYKEKEDLRRWLGTAPTGKGGAGAPIAPAATRAAVARPGIQAGAERARQIGEARRQIIGRAGEIRAMVERPLEKYHRQINELRRLYRAGALRTGPGARGLMGADETFRRAAAVYAREFLEATQRAPAGMRLDRPGFAGREQGPGALERGSRAAWHAIMGSMKPGDPQKRMAKDMAETKQHSKRIADGVEEIVQREAVLVGIPG